MLALKLELLFCVPNPQESESTVLAEVECWHPLATVNGSALSAMSGPVFQFSRRLDAARPLGSAIAFLTQEGH